MYSLLPHICILTIYSVTRCHQYFFLCRKSITMIFTRFTSQLLFPKLLISEPSLHPLDQSCIMVQAGSDLGNNGNCSCLYEKRREKSSLPILQGVCLHTHLNTALFLAPSRAHSELVKIPISSETSTS